MSKVLWLHHLRIYLDVIKGLFQLDKSTTFVAPLCTLKLAFAPAQGWNESQVCTCVFHYSFFMSRCGWCGQKLDASLIEKTCGKAIPKSLLGNWFRTRHTVIWKLRVRPKCWPDNLNWNIGCQKWILRTLILKISLLSKFLFE